MHDVRRLIVNADDFGLTAGVNFGIVDAHLRGIVTSTSLMVRQRAAAHGAALAYETPTLALGLHVDLGEWRFVDGSWRTVYQRVDLQNESAVAAEVEFQLERFRQLIGREPSHLDSHQHVHREEPLRSILLEHASKLQVSLRGCDPEVRYCGDFYGQLQKGEPYPEGISVSALLRIVAQLPTGTTELGCHPGFAERLDSAYKTERAIEHRSLCDPRVRAAVAEAGLSLCSFARIPRQMELIP